MVKDRRRSCARVRDPVCGATIELKQAYHLARDGEVFSFCSEPCLEAFSRDSARYVPGLSSGPRADARFAGSKHPNETALGRGSQLSWMIVSFMLMSLISFVTCELASR